MDAPAGDVPSLTDFEGVGLMGENPEEESDDSPECRESSSDGEASSSSSTVRNSYQVILFRE